MVDQAEPLGQQSTPERGKTYLVSFIGTRRRAILSLAPFPSVLCIALFTLPLVVWPGYNPSIGVAEYRCCCSCASSFRERPVNIAFDLSVWVRMPDIGNKVG